MDPSNSKAYFRKASALQEKKEFKEAIDVLKEASRLTFGLFHCTALLIERSQPDHNLQAISALNANINNNSLELFPYFRV